MNQPYIFYFKTPYGVVEFPITPGELTQTVGSNNKVVTLINEGEVNILKSPSLIEIEFEARFPTHKYPYSSEPDSIKNYFDIFNKLKEEKKPFKFLVARSGNADKSTGETNLLVSLEEIEYKEDANEGDDIIVSFKLKQYKEYGVKKLSNADNPISTSTANNNRNSKNPSQTAYTVQSGDCLWNIAKAAYGDGSKWTVIYEANKSIIEATAQKYGKNSSSNGHWIYPGTELIIPGMGDANLTVQKLGSGSTSNSNSSSNSNRGSSSNVNGGSNTVSNTVGNSGNDKYKCQIYIDSTNLGYISRTMVSYVLNGQSKQYSFTGSSASFSIDSGTRFNFTVRPNSGTGSNTYKTVFDSIVVISKSGAWTVTNTGATVKSVTSDISIHFKIKTHQVFTQH